MKFILKDGTEKETKQQIIAQVFDKTMIDKQEIVHSFLNIVGNTAMFMVEFENLPLEQWQISAKTEQYKRADGQYIYNGNFMSREYIEEQIKEKFVLIKATFNYILAMEN